MQRRTVLALAAGAVVSTAGCGRSAGSDTPVDPLVRSGPGDYPHDIYVRNAADHEVRLTLIVERGGTVIYRDTHDVAAGSGAVVAGITRRTLPEGDRQVAVTARSSDGQSSRVEVAVTDCLGSVDFSVDASGELRSTYSIC